MNDRPTSYLLAFALCSSVAFSQEPSQPEFTASIMGGSTIKGEVLNIDPENSTTRLHFEHSQNPIDIKTESIIALKRNNTSEPMEKSNVASDLLLMHNGDRFPAKVGDINQNDGTKIETDYSGNYTIPQGSLQRISFGIANLPIFSGPRKGQEWVFLPAENPTIEVNDGALIIKSSGSAAIDVGLTDCSIIDFTLPTVQGRYLSLALGSDALEASDKDDPNSPTRIVANGGSGAYFTGTAYVVRTSSRSLTLQGATVTPEGRTNYTDLGIRFSLPESGLSCQLSIGFNRRDKVIAFWANGEYLGKYLENGDWIGTGSAIVVGTPTTSAEITLSGITVREWHGVISDEFAGKGMQSKDVLTLATGERFTGSLVSKNDSEIIFETSLSKMTFPSADIATIDFGIGDAADEFDADDQVDEPSDAQTIDVESPVVKFGGIYGLKGDAFKLTDNQLQFTHPVLGKVSLPFTSIDSINFR